MPEFHSLRSFHRSDDVTMGRIPDNSVTGNQAAGTVSNRAPLAPDHRMMFGHATVTRPLPGRPQGPFPAVASNRSITTTQLPSPARTTTGLLNTPPPTTSSLISALQGTMTPKPTRPLLVIPAERKRPPQVAVTKKLQDEVKPRHRHLKSSIVLGAMMAFLLFTLFSLSPLSSSLAAVPGVGGAIKFVQDQQVNLSQIAAHIDPQTDTQTAPVTNNQPAVAPMTISKSQYVAIARQDAIDAGIPPDLFVRQIQQESGFNPNAYSPAGAIGIAQFIPSTAAGLGVDPYDPISSLRGAAKLMAGLSMQYGGNYAKALAAYNAGSGNVNAAVNAGGANWLAYLPLETQNYVRIIMGW